CTCPAWVLRSRATPETVGLDTPSMPSFTPLISRMAMLAFSLMRSRPVGTVLGCIFCGGSLPRAWTKTSPVSAPRCSSSSSVMLTSDPSSTVQPLLAVVLTMCSSWLRILFRYSCGPTRLRTMPRSEEHTSELQSRENLVCRLLLEKKNKTSTAHCCDQ